MKLTIKARLLVALCAGTMAAPSAFADGQPRELSAAAKRYQQYFREASKEFNVPVELLESIAYAESRWIAHVPKGQLKKSDEPQIEIDTDPHGGMPPTYGIMGLRNDTYFGTSLTQGAALIRVSPDVVMTDVRSNIRAAAALLSQYAARKTKNFPIEQWESAVARYSGIPQPEVAQIYTYEILTAIRQGREGSGYKIGQRHVEMEKVYGKDKLRKLSARRITLETGVPDPKISAPDFVDTPAYNE
ncbi:lytic transglycosylase domain-containing protein [Massilia sp. Dwa41.01b]|uniref:transglycosylase SLT domain-containing protein n=1 Tax=unclassified Massilia TaxID=2609279 RepID=UPI001601C91B|nr:MULTISPECIES: transglycosylase SLT domain-containing protein [unclassified Massilia]QNA88050.1 lytic transglycosylase domain-containing protein [Massilia sp. Dwa41.01b]QNA98956.1 lytic transglycosylase domain-containing protein [Massilia sp. Se16.2.3]